MPKIETPPPSTEGPNQEPSTPGGLPAPEFETLLQMRDDLSRSRMREAFWISLIVHLVAVIVIALSPKWLPKGTVVRLRTAEQLLADKELTYTEMPKDNQTPPKEVPNAKHLSDKNRRAETRTPELDKKTLERLRDMRRAGAPGMQAPPQPAQRPQMAQQPPSPQGPQGGAQAQGSGGGQQGVPQDNPRLAMNTPPPRPTNPFGSGSMSVGSQINAAARASARGGFNGGGGDYGLGSTPTSGRVRGNLEVLTDTQGVDFGPYLSRVLHTVRENWYALIPEEARAPLLKRGKVTIEFAIKPDGTIVALRIVAPSGDTPLDRAAYGGITASNPFSPLPSEFHGPYLALRFHFFYNPERGELD
jgi:TonB family protein